MRCFPSVGLASCLALGVAFTMADAIAQECETNRGAIGCGDTRDTEVDWSILTEIVGLVSPDAYPGCGVGGDYGSAEDTWVFACPSSGEVTVEVDRLECNVDLFVLDAACDAGSPGSCEGASTRGDLSGDDVTFSCVEGQPYFVVIERMEASLNPFSSCSVFSAHDYRVSLTCHEVCGDGLDNDGDGDVDCLDADCPDCTEQCADTNDNDFDGLVDCDDPDCAADAWCCDRDQDGFLAAGGLCGGLDCDDRVVVGASTYPGAFDAPADGVDQDCDGLERCFVDGDGDGHGRPQWVLSEVWTCDADGTAAADDDCDDTTADARPGLAERPYDGLDNDCDPASLDDDLDRDGYGHREDCNDSPRTGAGVSPGASEGANGNGIDDDCDGLVDEGTDRYDDDGDGVSERTGDCDDTDPAVHPGAVERANGIDDDCDLQVDEGLAETDDDGDGAAEVDGDCHDGDPTIGPGQPERPGNGIDDDCDGTIDDGLLDADRDGHAPTPYGADCDDSDDRVRPGAPETPDGIDNDCDGRVDEGTWRGDDDGDGSSEADGDCHDADPDIGPDAPERINGIDDDCDGQIDEGTPTFDDDADGLSELGGDCDDGDAARRPGADEVANGLDDDCDGEIDEGLADLDGDGFSTDAGDCDDTNGWAHPHGVEVCDGVDNDCNGETDEICGTTSPLTDGKDTAGAGCATAPSPSWLWLLWPCAWRRRQAARRG